MEFLDVRCTVPILRSYLADDRPPRTVPAPEGPDKSYQAYVRIQLFSPSSEKGKKWDWWTKSKKGINTSDLTWNEQFEWKGVEDEDGLNFLRYVFAVSRTFLIIMTELFGSITVNHNELGKDDKILSFYSKLDRLSTDGKWMFVRMMVNQGAGKGKYSGAMLLVKFSLTEV